MIAGESPYVAGWQDAMREVLAYAVARECGNDPGPYAVSCAGLVRVANHVQSLTSGPSDEQYLSAMRRLRGDDR